MKLREYQEKFVQELEEKVAEGKRDIAAIAPTGAGKTVMAGETVRRFLPKLKRKQKILFVADSTQLVLQAIAKFQEFGIKCGTIAGGMKENRQAPVQVATIQSLASRASIDWLEAGALFVDEAHTTSWYGECRNFRKAFPKVPFFHLTATPDRLAPDEEMGDICDALVCAPMPWQLMEMGFLERPTYYGLKDLEEAIATDSPEGIQLAATEYHRIAAGKPGIIFGKNVAHSKAIASAVCSLGYKAIAIDGSASMDFRKTCYEGLASGTINVLVSADLLVKGFDCPPVWYCGLWRDTQSKVIAFQQMGRVLRTHPGKYGCAISDAAGLTLPSRFGRIEDLSISGLVKSQERQKTEIRTKLCPICQARHLIFASKCGCGYAFSLGKKATAEFNSLERLCLLMSEKDLPKMLTYRQWLKSAFIEKEAPEIARLKYVDKFKTEPPNEWRKGAIFGDTPSQGDKKAYWEYLGNLPLQLKEKLMAFEFGDSGSYTFLAVAPTIPKRRSQRKPKQSTVSPGSHLPSHLSDVLKRLAQ